MPWSIVKSLASKAESYVESLGGPTHTYIYCIEGGSRPRPCRLEWNFPPRGFLDGKKMLAPRLLVPILLFSIAEAVEETVNVGYSVYKGQALSNGVSQWLGIRYAAPPLGELRFAPPQDPPHTEGVQDATQVSFHIHRDSN